MVKRGGIRLRISGGACVMGAVWLLTVPVQWAGAAFLAAAVHEAGHLVCLRLCRVPVWELRLEAFGARIGTGPMDRRQEVLSALAGPAAGLALALLWRRLPRTAVCALLQSGFNLLPVGALDGARALRRRRNMQEKPFLMENSVAKDLVSGYNDSD